MRNSKPREEKASGVFLSGVFLDEVGGRAIDPTIECRADLAFQLAE